MVYRLDLLCYDELVIQSLFLDQIFFCLIHRFVGGETNACYNAVDRHVANGNGQRTALIHDSPVTSTQRSITYAQLQREVCI